MATLLTGLSKHTFKKEWNIEDDLYIEIPLDWENGTVQLFFFQLRFSEATKCNDTVLFFFSQS